MTEYFTPTRVFFGKKAEEKVGEALRERGFRKALLHYGGKSAEKSGLLDRIRKDLDENGIRYVEIGGVVPNPRVDLVRKAIEVGKKEDVDIILAVGGGSTVDSAKAIAYGLYNRDGDIWEYYTGERKVKGAYPVAAVLTLSATGSEMSSSSVISNPVGHGYKRGLNSDWGRPLLAFLNPELTYTVSPYQTASGSSDIMMHTLERFFHSGDGLEFTDDLSITLLKSVMENTKKALADPYDYSARANLMWAGSLSHNGLMNTGNESRGDWACHQMEHELSAIFDVAHGAGLTAIWGSWARFVYTPLKQRFAILGSRLFSLEGSEDEKAMGAIERMEEFFSSIGMPTSVKEMGIELTEENIEALAWGATFHSKRTLGDKVKLGEEEIRAIFTASSRWPCFYLLQQVEFQT
ncbi:MAG: iron-containing alcohol dehydrogenase [Candidatus Ornithospirochaeta sp.]